MPIHLVSADAPNAFDGLFELTGEGWDDYAAAVAAGEPFEFQLQG